MRVHMRLRVRVRVRVHVRIRVHVHVYMRYACASTYALRVHLRMLVHLRVRVSVTAADEAVTATATAAAVAAAVARWEVLYTNSAIAIVVENCEGACVPASVMSTLSVSSPGVRSSQRVSACAVVAREGGERGKGEAVGRDVA